MVRCLGIGDGLLEGLVWGEGNPLQEGLPFFESLRHEGIGKCLPQFCAVLGAALEGAVAWVSSQVLATEYRESRIPLG